MGDSNVLKGFYPLSDFYNFIKLKDNSITPQRLFSITPSPVEDTLQLSNKSNAKDKLFSSEKLHRFVMSVSALDLPNFNMQKGDVGNPVEITTPIGAWRTLGNSTSFTSKSEFTAHIYEFQDPVIESWLYDWYMACFQTQTNGSNYSYPFPRLNLLIKYFRTDGFEKPELISSQIDKNTTHITKTFKIKPIFAYYITGVYPDDIETFKYDHAGGDSGAVNRSVTFAYNMMTCITESNKNIYRMANALNPVEFVQHQTITTSNTEKPKQKNKSYNIYSWYDLEKNQKNTSSNNLIGNVLNKFVNFNRAFNNFTSYLPSRLNKSTNFKTPYIKNNSVSTLNTNVTLSTVNNIPISSLNADNNQKQINRSKLTNINLTNNTTNTTNMLNQSTNKNNSINNSNLTTNTNANSNVKNTSVKSTNNDTNNSNLNNSNLNSNTNAINNQNTNVGINSSQLQTLTNDVNITANRDISVDSQKEQQAAITADTFNITQDTYKAIQQYSKENNTTTAEVIRTIKSPNNTPQKTKIINQLNSIVNNNNDIIDQLKPNSTTVVSSTHKQLVNEVNDVNNTVNNTTLNINSNKEKQTAVTILDNNVNNNANNNNNNTIINNNVNIVKAAINSAKSTNTNKPNIENSKQLQTSFNYDTQLQQSLNNILKQQRTSVYSVLDYQKQLDHSLQQLNKSKSLSESAEQFKLQLEKSLNNLNRKQAKKLTDTELGLFVNSAQLIFNEQYK